MTDTTITCPKSTAGLPVRGRRTLARVACLP